MKRITVAGRLEALERDSHPPVEFFPCDGCGALTLKADIEKHRHNCPALPDKPKDKKRGEK